MEHQEIKTNINDRDVSHGSVDIEVNGVDAKCKIALDFYVSAGDVRDFVDELTVLLKKYATDESKPCEGCGGTGKTSLPAHQSAGEIVDEEVANCTICLGTGRVS